MWECPKEVIISRFELRLPLHNPKKKKNLNPFWQPIFFVSVEASLILPVVEVPTEFF